MQRTKSALVVIPSSVYALPEVEFDEEHDLEAITAACASFLDEHCVRGDIVLFSDDRAREYRNDHRFAYDGEKLIFLFCDYIDYGTVPLEFLTFVEFPPAYFADSMAHNTVCWVLLTAGLKEELLAHSQPCGEDLWKSWAIIAGKPRQFRLACADVSACLDSITYSFAGQEYLICSGIDYEGLFTNEESEEEIAYIFDI